MKLLNEPNKKLTKPTITPTVLFWILIGSFVVLVSIMSSADTVTVLREYVAYFLLSTGSIFFLISIALLVLIVREKIEKKFKVFLILTGASGLGAVVSVILHNFVNGAFIYLFGENFWERIGITDEPFFFIIGTIIAPMAFLVGVVGSIVLFLRRRKAV